MKVKATSVSNEELTRRYGNQLRYNVGQCLTTINGHFYMQREEDVLHISDEIITTNHNCVFDGKELREVTTAEFEDKMKKVIFSLDIYQYCISK